MPPNERPKTATARTSVLVGYAAGVATAVPPISNIWPFISKIPENLIIWVWSALSTASEWLPLDEFEVNAPDIVEPKHKLALLCLAIGSLVPGVASVLLRSIVDEGAYLQSLGQSVAWIIIPSSILSFLFLPARMSILLVLCALAVSAIIVVKPSGKAEKVTWLLQGVLTVQTVALLVRGPSGEFVQKVQNYIGDTGQLNLNDIYISMTTQMWAIMGIVAGVFCLAVIRQAWQVMKPDQKRQSQSW